MNERTADRPKCLNELLGHALLDWQIQSLRQAGVQEIGIVTGYKREMLAQYPGIDREFHNPQWAQTNMVASLLCAKEWLSVAPIIVSYSDIVYRPSHITRLAESQQELTITYDRDWLDLWKLRFENPLSDAETFKLNPQGQLIEIGNRTDSYEEIQGQYMGLSKWTPTALEWLTGWLAGQPPHTLEKLDMTSALRKLMHTHHLISTVAISKGWCEVDSSEDADSYLKAIAAGDFSHDWRGE